MANEKVTFFVLQEAVEQCTQKYKTLLPQRLSLRLDELLELHEDLIICESLAEDDKSLQIYERAILRLAQYFEHELSGGG